MTSCDQNTLSALEIFAMDLMPGVSAFEDHDDGGVELFDEDAFGRSRRLGYMPDRAAIEAFARTYSEAA